MLTILKRACPAVVKNIVAQTEASQLDAFGDLGGTLFYCDNYMSLQHSDSDASWSLYMQLKKICLTDEFNFALTEWGVYYITEPEALWWAILLSSQTNNLLTISKVVESKWPSWYCYAMQINIWRWHSWRFRTFFEPSPTSSKQKWTQSVVYPE